MKTALWLRNYEPVTNELSQEHVYSILKQERRPRALFQMGERHLPIVQLIYE